MTTTKTKTTITVSRPYNTRRYPAVYYSRDVSVDGVLYGTWEGYASTWKLDWPRIRKGELSLVQYPKAKA